MNEQLLAFRPNSPIFISTPFGLITIERVEGKPGDGFRRVRLRMPKPFQAFVGDKPSLKVNEHVVTDKDGKVIPKFTLLAPLTDENGELIGVISPTALRLDETIIAADEAPVDEPAAKEPAVKEPEKAT